MHGHQAGGCIVTAICPSPRFTDIRDDEIHFRIVTVARICEIYQTRTGIHAGEFRDFLVKQSLDQHPLPAANIDNGFATLRREHPQRSR